MIKKINKEYYEIIDRIKSLDYSDQTDIELLNRSKELKNRYSEEQCNNQSNEQSNMSLTIEAYALAFESSKRNLGLSPFDVQLLGALFLNKNTIIQMQTGEGKTLCAVFAAYLNVLIGKHVHILTFNDYLAKRDANWMRPIYESLGVSVAYVNSGMSVDERKEAYKCDVTYVTAKEAGFDYLRDCLVYDKQNRVHDSFQCAIIDEADSILLDEAGIPLVIAGETESDEIDSVPLAEFVKGLTPDEDYRLDEYERNVYFTDAGEAKIEEHFQISNLYDNENMGLLTNLNCALHAEVLFTKDVNYIVKDGKVQLIDENTGRIASNRHWPDGLQEAVEVKEGFAGSSKGKILGNISILNFLELYKEKSGMTGTAISSQEEFAEVYDLDVVKIPPNKESIRIDYPDQVYKTKEQKIKAIIREIAKIHKTERPILIGTSSIEESEDVSRLLKDGGIKCTVLNAKNDEAEAQLIAKAGRRNAVTVSTNMAGRGVDIKLGGGVTEEAEQIDEMGGLCIIATGKNESMRIDDQLRGRAGRQGDAGSSKFFVSIEDDIMVRFGVTESLESASTKLKTDQNGKVTNRNIDSHISHIQRVIDGQNHEVRTTLNKYAYMMEQQRTINQETREQILSGDFVDISKDSQALISNIESMLGKNKADELIKQVLLFKLDSCWVDFLEYINYVREGIHLVSLGREDPLYHYHLQIIEGFEDMKSSFDKAVSDELMILSEKGEDYVPQKIADVTSPTATWSYIISDNEFMNRIRKGKFSKNKVHFVTMKSVLYRPVDLFAFLKNKIKNRG